MPNGVAKWITDWTKAVWTSLAGSMDDVGPAMTKLFQQMADAFTLWLTGPADAEKSPTRWASVRYMWSTMVSPDSWPIVEDDLKKLLGGLGVADITIAWALCVFGGLSRITPWFLNYARIAGMDVLDGKQNLPIEPNDIVRLLHGSKSRQDVVKRLYSLRGYFDEAKALASEATRTTPDIGLVSRAYLRGIISWEKAVEYLNEMGFEDTVKEFTPGDPEWRFSVVDRARGDVQMLQRLMELTPGVTDIIPMEVRDAFPKAPNEYPEGERGVVWDAWKAATGAHRPEVYDWEIGSEKDIHEALREGTKFGPQSLESWYLKARLYYTTTYEKVAQSQGLPPYWAMKYWEAHWKQPDVNLIREMLFRLPNVTTAEAKMMLRWQDYPPGQVDDIVKILYKTLSRVDVRRMEKVGVLDTAAVFRSYLDQGYSPEGASQMTAFTVVSNSESRYSKAINDIRGSYVNGVYTLTEAGERLTSIMMSDLDTEIPIAAADRFSPEEMAKLRQVLVDVREALAKRIEDTLYLAVYLRQSEQLDDYVTTAKSAFTSWKWSEEQTVEYLTDKGIAFDRIQGLMELWWPRRQRTEKLPSREMLGKWAKEGLITPIQYTFYMSKLGYAHLVIVNEWVTLMGTPLEPEPEGEA